MISKKDAVKLLEENGYKAEINNKVVFAIFDGDEDPFNDVKELLRANDYQSSFGTWRKQDKTEEAL